MISTSGDRRYLNMICERHDGLFVIQFDFIANLTSKCSSYVIIWNKVRYVKYSKRSFVHVLFEYCLKQPNHKLKK